MNSKIIVGVLHGFFETGTEGVIWAVEEDGKNGYEALKIIDKNDELIIYNVDNTIKWEGKIDPDFKVGWCAYPWVMESHKQSMFCGKSKDCSEGHDIKWAQNHNLGQQVSNGMYVHWIQKGFSPDDWGKMFFHSPALKAKLIKNK